MKMKSRLGRTATMGEIFQLFFLHTSENSPETRYGRIFRRRRSPIKTSFLYTTSTTMYIQPHPSPVQSSLFREQSFTYFFPPDRKARLIKKNKVSYFRLIFDRGRKLSVKFGFPGRKTKIPANERLFPLFPNLKKCVYTCWH